MKQPKLTIGCDDSGRGALAGPLVVTAFTHPASWVLAHLGARDSKVSSHDARIQFEFSLHVTGYGKWVTSMADAAWVDTCGHSGVTSQKFVSAIEELMGLCGTEPADTRLLVDGLSVIKGLPVGLEAQYIAKGDRTQPLISAASQIATLAFERAMKAFGAEYPGWDFETHHGYDTPEHVRRLYARGPTPIHRKEPTLTRMRNHCQDHGLDLPTWFESYRLGVLA